MDEPEAVFVDRDVLLDNMRTLAYREAATRLSDEGKEVLGMISTADFHTDMSTLEANMESSGIEGLPPDEQLAIEVYLARITLIEELKTFEG